MANTTDMMITCFDEVTVVAAISKKTKIDFFKISDVDKAGGNKTLIFESFGACYRSLGKEKIDEIIATFKAAKFMCPEVATLTIDDDSIDFSCVILGDKL